MQVRKFRIRAAAYEVGFSPSGELVAIVGTKVNLWNMQQRKMFTSNAVLEDPAYIAFSPDNQSYAIKNTAGEIIVCELSTGDLKNHYKPAEHDEGCGIAFSADGQYLVDGSWNGRISTRHISPNLPEVYSEEYPDCMIIDCSHDVGRSLWAFAVTTKITHPGYKERLDVVAVYRWHDYKLIASHQIKSFTRIWRAQLSPDGSRIAVIHDTSNLTIVDLSSTMEGPSAVLQVGGSGSGTTLAWSPDGQFIAVVQDAKFSILDAADLSVINPFETAYPSAVAFSHDGQWLALGTWQQAIVVPTGELLRQ